MLSLLIILDIKYHAYIQKIKLAPFNKPLCLLYFNPIKFNILIYFHFYQNIENMRCLEFNKKSYANFATQFIHKMHNIFKVFIVFIFIHSDPPIRLLNTLQFANNKSKPINHIWQITLSINKHEIISSPQLPKLLPRNSTNINKLINIGNNLIFVAIEKCHEKRTKYVIILF